MTSFKTTAVIAFGALLLSAPLAFAQMDAGGGMQQGGMMKSHMMKSHHGMMKSHHGMMKSHGMKHGMSMSKGKMGSGGM